jgi:hypothetical protein
MTVTPMAITKAVSFVMAIFLLFTPPLLAAQAPTSGAGKPNGAALQAPGKTWGRSPRFLDHVQSDFVDRLATSITPWAAHGNEVNVPGVFTWQLQRF